VPTVRDVMETDPVTVSPDDDIESVVRLLREHGLPGVPVVNEGGRCVGIVTENDLVLRDSGADLHLPHHIDCSAGSSTSSPSSTSRSACVRRSPRRRPT